MNKLNDMVINSFNAHKEIKPDLHTCAETRWEAKEVFDIKVIHDCQDLQNVKHNGIGTLEVSNKSLRGKNSLLLTTNTDIEGISPRPSSGLELTFDKEDWSSYNRISLWVYPESVGFQNFYFHFNIINEKGKGLLHAPSLTPNVWNHVIWELDEFDRHKIVKLGMTPFLMGCPPEAMPIIKVYFDDIQLQKVEPDHVDGWGLDGRIAYCHSGYFCNAKKVAISQKAEDRHFTVFNDMNQAVFKGEVVLNRNEIGDFYEFDFSDLTTPGNYYLQISNRRTEIFNISDEAYSSSIWKSINFLRMLRCGDDVSEVHSPCHLNCYTMHPDGRFVPNHGGWHDAGDVSQFEICTAEMIHGLLDLAASVMTSDKALSERLLEEARWGLNWLLRTRFGDGYRALAVHYSIWRKNIIQNSDAFKMDNPIFKNNLAENGPFENFCAAAAEAVGARLFKDIDPVFASWCKRCAEEDFRFGVEGYKNGIFTKRWGKGPEVQVCGEGAVAAAELYALTGDDSYLLQGDEYAMVVLACQQQEYPNWEKPLCGFFYEDQDHTRYLTYEHRGHEQTAVQGLSRLYEVASHHSHSNNWKRGLELYRQYILDTCHVTAPYNLLPAQIYEFDKLSLERFTIPSNWGTDEEVMSSFKNQIESGIKLNEGIYLRRLPVAIQRRGYHATLLSKTKAVTCVAKVLNDEKLMQVAIDQMEWILGKNPFASSSMYGEGHNYHPLYVAFSRQIVGALPVGFKTLNNFDRPYWPTNNNAVFKEIWGHTTGKYLWVLADLISR